MEVYMDEKWKLAKKGSRREQSRREQSRREQQLQPEQQQQQSSLKRSASMPESLKRSRSTTKANQSSKSSSSKAFPGRCANLVKEQRAKFYIVRRCVSMLLCWRDYP